MVSTLPVSMLSDGYTAFVMERNALPFQSHQSEDAESTSYSDGPLDIRTQTLAVIPDPENDNILEASHMHGGLIEIEIFIDDQPTMDDLQNLRTETSDWIA